MTDVPNIEPEQGEVTVQIENGEAIIPDVNKPPVWLDIEVEDTLVNVHHEHGEVKAGFDLTDFRSAETFVEMLQNIDMDPYWRYARVEKSPGEREYYAYVWVNENGMIICGNNPITGEYSNPQDRVNQQGYASYIGVEGTEEFVQRATETIQEYAESIKDYNPNEREFI